MPPSHGGSHRFKSCSAHQKCLIGIWIREERLEGRSRRQEARKTSRPAALTADDRARALRLAASGRSQREIAELLDVGKGTIHRLLAEVPRDSLRESTPDTLATPCSCEAPIGPA